MTENDWTVTYRGKLFEILQNEKGWEKAARAPGVRVILDDQAAGKILIQAHNSPTVRSWAAWPSRRLLASGRASLVQ